MENIYLKGNLIWTPILNSTENSLTKTCRSETSVAFGQRDTAVQDE